MSGPFAYMSIPVAAVTVKKVTQPSYFGFNMHIGSRSVLSVFDISGNFVFPHAYECRHCCLSRDGTVQIKFVEGSIFLV